MSVYHYDNARVARRLIGFILIVVGVALMTLLYYVKISAQSAKSEMRRLEAQIDKEVIALNVLRAELAYLENPARLQALAEENLGLQPTEIGQIVTEADIASLFKINESQLSEDQLGVSRTQGARP